MLRRLFIDNYKCFENCTIEFAGLDLLIGNNGTGKSSVIEVLRKLRRLVAGEQSVLQLFPPRLATRWTLRDKMTFELEFSAEGKSSVYAVVVHLDRGRASSRLEREELSLGGQVLFKAALSPTPDNPFLYQAQLYRDNGTQGPQMLIDWTRSGLPLLEPRPDNTMLTAFRQQMAKLLTLRINPLAMQARSESERQVLDDDLQDFVSWLRHVSQEAQDDYYAFLQALRDVFEDFEGLRFPTEEGQTRNLSLKFRCATSDNVTAKPVEFRLDELSDGQRAMVALYALKHCAAKDGTILCLDEPANFLALPEIQPWVLQLRDSVLEQKCQSVIVTHHPELVNLLAASHGLWFERPQNGLVRVTRVGGDGTGVLPVSELIARGWLHGS